MKVTYSDKELLESIEFIALGLGETKVQFERDGETAALIFDFKEGEKQNLSFELVSEEVIKISLENWSDTFPMTLKEVLKIGTFLSREIFIIFSIAKLGSIGEFRKINLSIYLGKEVENGQA